MTGEEQKRSHLEMVILRMRRGYRPGEQINDAVGRPPARPASLGGSDHRGGRLYRRPDVLLLAPGAPGTPRSPAIVTSAGAPLSSRPGLLFVSRQPFTRPLALCWQLNKPFE